MSWTKRELVEQAFAEAGLAAFIFDLDADQIQRAIRSMNQMIATWYAKGIRLSANDSIDPDDDSGVPDYGIEAVYTNLAIRLGPSYGKVISPELKMAAKMAYDVLLNKAARPQEAQITGLPSGAGNKSVDYPFLIPANTNPIQVGDNDQLIFNGD